MKTEKRMFLSFLLNFAFTIIEFIGGIITNSVALISDSVHDLGDSISMGIAIFLERKSKQKPDELYTYGYRRFSLLGALVSSLILIFGSAFIVIESVNRLLNPEEINSELLIYFAILGVIVNGLAAFNISKGHSLNEKLITLHLIEDVLGWITLLIGAIIMYFTDIVILDAILSLGFTLFILYQVFKNLKKIFRVLLERVPKGLSVKEIKNKLSVVDKVVEIHHIHLWSLEGENPLLTLHAVLEENIENNEITKVQTKLTDILEGMGIKHSTIQVELENKPCDEEKCDIEEAPNTGHQHHH